MDEELSPYLRYFDVSATGFAWQEPRPDQIVRRRADMDDKFIFDILLVSGGIEKPDTLFPPRNVEDLRALLLAIWDSAYDILKKECLVYYLLKWHLDGREERLQIDRCIPPQFTALADAYWHLDAGVNIPRAVSILSDNRLNREYASKILHAISISSNPSPLVVQYVRTAKPLLTAPQDVWTYTLALADSSLLEAWQFQRTFNETEELRTQLLEKILDWCISPSPRTTALTAFLSLPLSSFEEQFLHKYALEPPKSLSRPSIAILRDLICVRLIQSGKYAEAIKADHQFAASTLNESKTHSQDRRKMVQDLYAALPLAERMLLDSELELELITNGGQQKPKPTPTPTLTINGMPSRSTTTNNKENKNNKTGAADASMSLSLSQTWEKIPRPTSSQPLTNGHAHGLAPRFGGPHLGASTSAVAAAPTTAPPLIPVSTPGTATANGISTSQGFPLSLSLSLSQSQPQSQTSTRKSFGTAQHAPFFPGGASSKGSSSSSRPLQRQPQFDFNASTSTMTSASRKANAFYKPPVQSQPQNAGGGGGSGVKRPFEDLAGSAAGTGTGKGKGGRMEVDMDGDEEMDLDFDVEHERVAKKEKKPQEDEDDDDDEDEMEDEGHREREQEQEQEQGLGFSVSVFGNGPPPRAAHHTQTQTQTQTKTKPAPAPARTSRGSKTSAPAPAVARTSRRVPPGAFASDDDEEEDEGEEEEPPAPTTTTTARSTRTRTSARHTRTSTAAAAAAAEPQSRRRAREVERDRDRDLGRSLPGSLMDEDEDEQEEDGEEAADYVAPLREEASPPVRRGVRRVRSTTPGSDMGDEDGAAQTRRRSSRLSTAGVSPPPPPPPSKKASSAGTGAGVTKARKSRAVGGAVKKKR